MKKGIHPNYVDATVRCSCGNTFATRATKPDLHVELCNACHPFYTGQQKFVDTGGRVQRFADKYGSAASAVSEREAAKKAEKAAVQAAAAAAAKTLREEKAAEKAKKAARYADKAAREAVVVEPEATEAPAAEAAVEAPTAEAPLEAPVAEAPATEAVEASAEAAAE